MAPANGRSACMAGALVEAVLIPEGDRATLCVSSQVGCSLDCKFCSTGKQGFQRDLTAAEIIGQVWLAIDSYGGWQSGKGRVVTNVVMMGMGEPLAQFRQCGCGHGPNDRRSGLWAVQTEGYVEHFRGCTRARPACGGL